MLAGATSQQEPLEPSCLLVNCFVRIYKNGALVVVRLCDDVNADGEHAVLVSAVNVREVSVADHHDLAGLDGRPQRDGFEQSVGLLEVMADDSDLQFFLDGLGVKIAPVVVRPLDERDKSIRTSGVGKNDDVVVPEETLAPTYRFFGLFVHGKGVRRGERIVFIEYHSFCAASFENTGEREKGEGRRKRDVRDGGEREDGE